MALRLMDYVFGSDTRFAMRAHLDAYASFVAEEAVLRRKALSLERQLWRVKARLEIVTNDMEQTVRDATKLIGK